MLKLSLILIALLCAVNIASAAEPSTKPEPPNKSVDQGLQLTVCELIERGKRFEAEGDAFQVKARNTPRNVSNQEFIDQEAAAYKRAIAYYTQAIEQEPKSARPYQLRGYTIAKHDKDANTIILATHVGSLGYLPVFTDQSLKDLDTSIELAAKDKSLYMTRGLIYRMQFSAKWLIYSDLTESNKKELGTVLDDIRPDINLARHARDDFHSVLALDPKNGEAHDALGILHARLTHFEKTLYHYKKAQALGISIDPEMLERLEAGLAEHKVNPIPWFNLPEYDLD